MGEGGALASRRSRESRLFSTDVSEVVTIYSDAAGTATNVVENNRRGWGGVIHRKDLPPRLLQGPFGGAERDAPIHIKECLAALFMLRCSGVRDAYVILFTDNMSVFHSLRKFHSKHEEFGPVVQSVVMYCIENNVSLRVEWLSSAANSVADEQSRIVTSLVDRSDVMLSTSLLIAVQRWGRCTCVVDICATPENRQTHRFVGRIQWVVECRCSQDCMSAGLGQLLDSGGSRA